LFVGGNFTTAGPISANYIARWDGGSFSPVGSGLNERVHALMFHEGDLIAGGDFTQAGLTPVNHIARWTGSTWSALGTGMGGVGWPAVRALATYGGDLVAGGWFAEAGGDTVNYVARWDGGTWHSLGGGLSAWVHSLLVYDGDLIAGGEFTTAGDEPVNYIARWDGAAWSGVDSGLSSWVLALTEYETYLFAGGWFIAAGNKPSFFIARWDGMAASDVVVSDITPGETAGIRLVAASQNPFRDQARFAFFLPEASVARLSIHDVEGRRIAQALDRFLPAGWHRAAWDGRTASGGRSSPGVYFARLEALGTVRSRRVLLTGAMQP
jgi:hypothetical protein